jgi:hypothetical protein
MKKYLLLPLLFVVLSAEAQQKIEIGIDGLYDFPVSNFRMKSSQAFDQNGGAKDGWGLSARVIHHIHKYFFYGLSFSYFQSKVDYENLDYKVADFIQNSPNPAQYTYPNNDFYAIAGSSWSMFKIDIPLGTKIMIKRFTITADIRSGVAVVSPPVVVVNEYRERQGLQSYVLIAEMDRFKAKPVLLYEYGCDVKIGYNVYKHLNASVGFSYLGTTNANVTYFSNPNYGYNRTIQTMGLSLGVSYDIQLKKKKITQKI